ncbi:MAG: tetratricopeptide repeat protein, partial [Kiritimatiellia bacterium]
MSAVSAQEGSNPVEPVLSAQEKQFEQEADFIGHLADMGLFEYTSLALEEARARFPELSNRVQVLEVATLLRQGKTQDVEKILAGRNLNTDMKAQAMLLQLAMTYDAMGNNPKALENYQKFLSLNEGKEITDPDVLRYFASAGLRLSMILKDEGKWDEAGKVLDLVIQGTTDNYLKRKFFILAAQNRLDQALTQSGSARNESLQKASDYANELLWGGNDNYFYMAMGIKAWIEFVQGNPQSALETLNQSKVKAIAMEKTMEESEVP